MPPLPLPPFLQGLKCRSFYGPSMIRMYLTHQPNLHRRRLLQGLEGIETSRGLTQLSVKGFFVEIFLSQMGPRWVGFFPTTPQEKWAPKVGAGQEAASRKWWWFHGGWGQCRGWWIVFFSKISIRRIQGGRFVPGNTFKETRSSAGWYHAQGFGF